jgi:hypothetical protein
MKLLSDGFIAEKFADHESRPACQREGVCADADGPARSSLLMPTPMRCSGS